MGYSTVREPQGLSWVWSWLRALPFMVVTGVALACYQTMQYPTLLIYPFSRALFRRVNQRICWIWISTLAWTTTRLAGMRVEVLGDELPLQRNALAIGNHQQMPDIPAAIYLATRQRALGGVKFFVKRVLAFVPFMGWGMWFLDFLIVKRAWAEDKDTIRRVFGNLREYAPDVPFWIIMYPEGTRLTPAKLKRTQEFARRRDLPHLEHVMLPRPKGFVETVKALRDKLDGVYDMTLGYPRGVPTLLQMARGLAGTVQLHVRRFPSSSLPRSDAELAAWLQERFVEKERMMAHFKQHGRFPEQHD